MKSIIHGILVAVLAATLHAQEAPSAFLTLQQAKEEALRNHPAYASAQLQALLAKETLKEVQSAYFPTAAGYVDAVGVGSNNTRILAGGLNNPSVYNRVADGLQVTQLITDFGKTRNLSKGAKAQEKAAEAGAESSREQVLLNVEANFLATLQADAILGVAKQTVATRRLLVDRVDALAKNQLRSELDVSFANVGLEQAELLLQTSEGELDDAMASLGAALGRKGTERFVLADDHAAAAEPPAIADAVATALAQRPDLLSLREQRDAAQSAARAAKDANYPTLAAVGVLGNALSEDPRLPDKYAVAGVQLTIPIFEGGLLTARQHEAEIVARESDETLRGAEDNAVRDVRQAVVAARTAYRRLATTRELLKNADQAYDLAQARYKAGSSSIVELSEAQLNQTSAAIAFANAEYDSRLRAAVLDFQTGALR
jgi:outer membrane protein